MVFMDIGCGYGFFTIPAAEQVGENGRVYAVDASAESIENLKRKVAEKGLKNIVAKAEEAEKTVFCDECADMVFFSENLEISASRFAGRETTRGRISVDNRIQAALRL